MTGAAVSYGLLGPLEIRVHDRPVNLSGHRERAIVGCLMLHAGEVVSADHLADAVWGHTPPPTSAVQIQACVAALRKRLAAAGVPEPRALLVTRRPGYVLSTESATVDLEEFRRLVELATTALRAGDAADAVTTFRQALDRWRGEPLQDVSTPLLDVAADRLTQEWLVAVEGRIEGELALGSDAELVPELVELVSRYPRRDRVRAHLMLALHRAGRQADALQAYQDGRRRLADELGLDPGQELRRLEQRILEGDSDLLVTAEPAATPSTALPVPRQLPADLSAFVGREEHVRSLLARLTPDDTRTAPTVLCLHGGGGIGKTALAVHLAHLARTSFPDGQVYASLGGTAGHRVDPSEVLAAFLRAFGIDGQAMPSGLEERAALYRSCVADRRVLVVLDDAADAAQVRPLLPPTSGCGVVVTSRPALTDLVSAHHTAVDTLDEDDALALLAGLVGDAQGDHGNDVAAGVVVDLCGRLPLAIRVIAAQVTATGRRGALARIANRLTDEHRRLDVLQTGDLAVRATLLLSWRSLDDDQRRLLRRLALLPRPDFPDWIGAPLLDTDEGTAHTLLDDLAAAHLVEDDGDDPAGGATYRLHELVRLVARERVEAEESQEDRTAAVSRVLRTWLGLAERADALIPHGRLPGDQPSAGVETPPEPAAAIDDDALAWLDASRHQLVAAAEFAAAVDPDLAALLTLRCDAYLGLRRYDDERIRMLERVGAMGATPDLQVRLLLALSSAYLQRGDEWRKVRAVTERAVEAAKATDDVRLEVAVGLERAYVAYHATEFDRAVTELRGLLPQAGEAGRDLHIRTLYRLGEALLEDDRYAEALPVFAAALAEQEEFGATRTRAQMLHDRAQTLLALDRLDEADEDLTEALAITGGIGDDNGSAVLRLGRAVVAARRGDWPAADELLADAAAYYRSSDHHAGLVVEALTIGRIESIRGNHDLAVRSAQRASRLAEESGVPMILRRARRALAEATAHAGEPA
ncbi:MAG: tetratricopeptide repeat protein [Streptosporangiales bacterium]|nr:tetratricopeptide repeat protein [Streptosporangiales bacterium]